MGRNLSWSEPSTSRDISEGNEEIREGPQDNQSLMNIQNEYSRTQLQRVKTSQPARGNLRSRKLLIDQKTFVEIDCPFLSPPKEVPRLYPDAVDVNSLSHTSCI